VTAKNRDDLYAVLQVQPTASQFVISAAYRVLAKKRHPDAGGTPQQMTELNHAWAVLGDPGARRAYNRERATAAMQAAAATCALHTAAPRPSGRVNRATKPLDFGPYRGWTLVDLAQRDPEYLRWLAGTPAGRRLQPDVEALLGGRTS
jgi:curved DNA-binding protein CbpA